jgi:flagellar biosynthetic protein FliP
MAGKYLQIPALVMALVAVSPALAADPDGTTTASVVATSAGAPAASSWQAHLAGLDSATSGWETQRGGAPSAAVEKPTVLAASVNPLARLGGLWSLLMLVFGGLLLHPRTSSALKTQIGRVVSAPFPNTRIGLETVHRLGGNQRMVRVEVEGASMLVGLSRGRLDLLHVWGSDSNLQEASAELFGDDFVAESRAVPLETPALLSNLSEVIDDDEPCAGAAVSAVVETVFEASDLCIDSLVTGSCAPLTMEPLDLDAEPLDLDKETLQDAHCPPGGAREPAESPLARTLARVEAVGEEIDQVLSARVRSHRPAQGKRGHREPAPREGGQRAPAPGKRGFRGAAARGEGAVYKNRRWLGPARGVAGLLLVLAPILLGVIAPALLGLDMAFAAGDSDATLKLELGGAGDAGSATAVKLLVVLTMLAMAPAIVLSMTSFTRMIVVFSLMRQAVGVQQAPPNQILVGLALFLTWFVMAPTFQEVNEVAVQPYQEGTVNEAEAVAAAMVPMKAFMLRNTRESDLGLFMRLSKMPRPETRGDLPIQVLVPAFIISELKTAFQIGFLIYLPFLIIDIVVSVVLLAMGMMVLPPVVISLPFKLLLFVFVDGWNLLIGSMVSSFV